ncbi:hypothetical protein HDU98_009845 [Podochytrium sp. JEL0797]|nr:hypothetical protein HDU98_009845 [Podochytrium sp. JEL0797]
MSMLPPGFKIDYPMFASWYSEAAAWICMCILIVMMGVMAFNLVYLAKTGHSKMIYAYLIMYCVLRIVAFAIRGYDLVGDHGQNFSDYKAAMILISLGFMPLAEILGFNVLETSSIIYKYTHSTYKKLKILLLFLFVTFGSCVAIYVFDFVLNKPFGAKTDLYRTDLVLREFGFDGLFGICIFALFASLHNAYKISSAPHIATEFKPRLRNVMFLVAFQSCLMCIKLAYTTYRNWRPESFKSECGWYLLSIMMEMLYVVPFMSHRWLSVYDDIYSKEEECERKEGVEEMRDLEEGWMGSSGDSVSSVEKA